MVSAVPSGVGCPELLAGTPVTETGLPRGTFPTKKLTVPVGGTPFEKVSIRAVIVTLVPIGGWKFDAPGVRIVCPGVTVIFEGIALLDVKLLSPSY
jgi:hypothetical protein